MNRDVVLSILDVEDWADIKHGSQHGSFCRKMLQAMSTKRWKLVGKV